VVGEDGLAIGAIGDRKKKVGLGVLYMAGQRRRWSEEGE
jgi:hypothetical protein